MNKKVTISLIVVGMVLILFYLFSTNMNNKESTLKQAIENIEEIDNKESQINQIELQKIRNNSKFTLTIKSEEDINEIINKFENIQLIEYHGNTESIDFVNEFKIDLQYKGNLNTDFYVLKNYILLRDPRLHQDYKIVNSNTLYNFLSNQVYEWKNVNDQ
ncbi:hypothetical protein [Tenuibacillus multivorans]|uniref:Uncharacterized protein n=1 Tax=Tenuibacillus multivorans TaxID=237069 RepID=A0A1H0ARH6_9BACI|nr:hypothetical protein [Tenuibacillus multivorans]GEL77855.1 hypothetical protein TMU01_20900 [Tenuibacillus multivorans]SDN35971.1 hypothetical protein SAMN05216498_2040 [Tenuibacillus multivorans]